MFTAFNSESLWIGTDLKRFNEIRDVLDRENIKYKYKTSWENGQAAERSGDVWEVQEIQRSRPSSMKSLWIRKIWSRHVLCFRNNIILFIRHQNLRECSKRIWCLFYAAKIEINFT